jgi:phosphomannomutase
MLNPHIFRQYDIRGVVGPDITPEVAEGIGRAFASLARRRLGKDAVTLGVGRDNRLTSDELAAAVRRGIRRRGWTWSTWGWCRRRSTPLRWRTGGWMAGSR